MKQFLFFLALAINVWLPATAQNLNSISGTVLNSKNQAVIGATVRVLNTNRSTVSDISGKFIFSNLAAGSYVFSITAVGYATQIKQIVVSNDGLIKITLASANNQLDEVTVTAQKREENIQQLPVSISSISATQVQEYQLKNLKDITAIIPNLYSANPGDNRNVTSIRGITTTSYDPAVATYVDGVNQFGLDTYISQLLDVERIEVLRGPQGTLYGRNAMGGVINVITKQPSNSTKGFLQTDFGNYGLQRYNLGVSAPLVKDKLFFGLSGLFNNQHGFYTNTFNNAAFDKQQNLMGNYYLKFLPTSKLSLSLNLKHNSNHNNGTFPLAPSKEAALKNSFQVNQNALTRMTDNVLNTSLSISYAGKAVNFTSQSAYQSNYRYYNNPIDGDFSPIDGITLINNYGHDYNNVKVLSQEIKFSSTASNVAPIKWTTGAYGFYQHNPTKQATYFGTDAVYVGVEDGSNFSLINTSKGKGYGIALFGQATYKINPKLDFTLGARYDYEYKKLKVLGEYQQDPNPNPVFETRPDTSSNASFNAFSPQASINFYASKNSIIYTSYNQGFRAGGLSTLGSDPSQPPLIAYKPEYSNSFEIGFKNNLLDNKLMLNASLFYTRVTNAQVPTLILPDAVTVTKNAGKLTSKGAELEVDAKVAQGLSLEYNLGFTDAKYKKLNLSQYGTAVNLSGKRQLFTPKTTMMTALQYVYTVSSGLKLIARGEWRYLGKQYFDLANTISQSAFSLINARVGVSAAKLEAYIWANNFANKTYIDYAYDFGAAHLGNPRTLGLTLRTNF